jgi:hypothetical protein
MARSTLSNGCSVITFRRRGWTRQRLRTFTSNFVVDRAECPSVWGLSATMAGDQDRVATNRADRHRTNVAYVQGLKVRNDP